MYPDDYLGAYDIIEESEGCVKILSKITTKRCRHCDQETAHSHGTKSKIVYDIDARTGGVVKIEAVHHRYICTDQGCSKSFILDVLPSKCFPNEIATGRTNKSKSKDILNAAMDCLIFGSNEDGTPVTISQAAKRFGYDRKVLESELHARVSATIQRHILSNEICNQVALVPFEYGGIIRCAIIGYTQESPKSRLKPVLYDLRSVYNPDDLYAYLSDIRFQNLVVPEVTYLDMDEDLIDLVYKLYVDDYSNPHGSFFTGIIKSIVKEKIQSVTSEGLTTLFGISQEFYYFRRKLTENLYDMDWQRRDDESGYDLVNADFEKNGIDFYEILESWKDELSPDVIAQKFQPLYDELFAFADSIDVSMTRYREDGIHPEDELGFVKYMRKMNWSFEEMHYRVHCLSTNKQGVPFMSLMDGSYAPSVPGRTLQRYYIDLDELNRLFCE